MNNVEEFWNDRMNETRTLANGISDYSDQYLGTTVSGKYMHNDDMRHRMFRIHDWHCWMKHVASFMRYLNEKNMQVYGISEAILFRLAGDK
jgi:hypothetical protein